MYIESTQGQRVISIVTPWAVCNQSLMHFCADAAAHFLLEILDSVTKLNKDYTSLNKMQFISSTLLTGVYKIV